MCLSTSFSIGSKLGPMSICQRRRSLTSSFTSIWTRASQKATPSSLRSKMTSELWRGGSSWSTGALSQWPTVWLRTFRSCLPPGRTSWTKPLPICELFTSSLWTYLSWKSRRAVQSRSSMTILPVMPSWALSLMLSLIISLISSLRTSPSRESRRAIRLRVSSTSRIWSH